MKTVILIKGLKRSGKDTTADIMVNMLQDKHSVSKLSFAEPMKEILADTFCISREFLERAKNIPDEYQVELSDTIGLYLETNFREILQRFGTEAMKKQFGDNVWVELAYNKIHSDITIISDWRFKNELEYLKSKGDVKVVTVQVIRAGQENTDTHISERDLDDVKCDFILENITDEVEVLECQIDAMLTHTLFPIKYPDFFKCETVC